MNKYIPNLDIQPGTVCHLEQNKNQRKAVYNSKAISVQDVLKQARLIRKQRKLDALINRCQTQVPALSSIQKTQQHGEVPALQRRYTEHGHFPVNPIEEQRLFRQKHREDRLSAHIADATKIAMMKEKNRSSGYTVACNHLSSVFLPIFERVFRLLLCAFSRVSSYLLHCRDQWRKSIKKERLFK